MSYYLFNREKILKKVKGKYHNKGGKRRLVSIIFLTEKFQKKTQEIGIETCQKKEKIKKEISKRKIPHEY